MKFRGGEFSTGTTGNFQSELTSLLESRRRNKVGLPHPGGLTLLSQRVPCPALTDFSTT